MRAASGAKVTARLLSSEVIRIATLYEVSEEVSLRLVRLYGAEVEKILGYRPCLLYTSPSPRDQRGSRMPSSA